MCVCIFALAIWQASYYIDICGMSGCTVLLHIEWHNFRAGERGKNWI